ncbi:MAG: uracil-DNA glycosylase [Bacillota bacterium]|jgi:uracil-DNA glycosylase family 4
MHELKRLAEQLQNCKKCSLSEKRQHMVFGKGSLRADIMFIGEGPGADEDRLGRPFVGRAGQLLDHLMEAAELPPHDIYICNVVKCRPPGNRLPQEAEIEACKPFLRQQIKYIAPKIIVCLGSLAAQVVIDPEARITKIRGQWLKKGPFHIMPTFHPAALLRDESKKREVYSDMRTVRDHYRKLKGFKLEETWPPPLE